MKHQQKTFSCGVAAVQNALECLGIVGRTQGALMKLMHCDADDGTSEDEIKRGLLACGSQVDEVSYQRPSAALVWLRDHVEMNGPAILCTDRHEHWVTVIGLVGGDSFVVFDPAKGCGVRVYTSEGLLSRWQAADDDGVVVYYGIGCSL